MKIIRKTITLIAIVIVLVLSVFSMNPQMAFAWDPNPLRANFEFTNVCYCTNTQFTDTTTGGTTPYTYQWDFDYHGKSTFDIDSTEENPSYHYDNPGEYWVLLKVTDSRECPEPRVGYAFKTVTVVGDTTAPEITCPADITVECDNLTDTGEATATDNCDQSPIVAYSDVKTPGDCPESYTITRTWTATDASENSSTCDQTITVDDTTAPVFDNCPEDITIICASVPEPPILTATDNCDTAVVTGPVEEIISGDVASSNYTMTRTWTATDACVNSVECVQIITVKPCETPPVEEEEEEKPCYCSLIVQKRDESGNAINGAVFKVDGIEKKTVNGDARWDNLECDTSYEVREISPIKQTKGIHLGDCGERSTLRVVNEEEEELEVLGIMEVLPFTGPEIPYSPFIGISTILAGTVLYILSKPKKKR